MELNKSEQVISGKAVSYYFDTSIALLERIVSKEKTILVTDENVVAAHASVFDGWSTIVIRAGEEHKQQSTVDFIIRQLIEKEADRSSFLVGVGGGVVTDIAGYAAGIYMRGIHFGFVPTTLLAMVDASIGGKNGVDVGPYKNLVGLIRQPEFLLFDYSLLQTLPEAEWVNGFAEIIKHASIRDREMFAMLEQQTLQGIRQQDAILAALIKKNVLLKSSVVAADEFEKGDRKLLNFGHTFGHAIENLYQLPHGHAVAIGMVTASNLSVALNGFAVPEKERLVQLILSYGLPVQLSVDKNKIWNLLRMDKKRVSDEMNFILLNAIGEGVIRRIPLNQLENLINQSL